MIKNVHGIGQYLVVYNNSASNYINNYSGSQGVGNMRFNTSNQTMEVYDGVTWQILKMGETTVSLTQDAVEALDWVKQKREEERKLKELSKKYPAVADQIESVREAEEKLRMIAALVQI
jgi:hypothetical protein